jgi:hypothetical protein
VEADMLSFTRVEFPNGAIIFLRPEDYKLQINYVQKNIDSGGLIVVGHSVEIEVAWNFALNLFHLPVAGSA